MIPTPYATIVMPVLNEEAALRRILPSIPAGIALVLVDNGSRDASRRLARESGATLVEHQQVGQVGACIEIGIAKATTDLVCVMDCDATVTVSDAAQLLGPILCDKADFVVGTRAPESPGWSTTHRAFGRARDWLTKRALHGWPFADLGSARAFRRSALGPNRPLDTRYGWNLDFTIHAVESLPQERIMGVNIPYHHRVGPSHISGSLGGALTAVVDQFQVLRLTRERSVSGLRESHRVPVAIV